MKLCMIGCGEHATSSHGPAQARYAATHPGTVLAACCDVDEGRARAHAERFGFARHDTDLAVMLERERPDAVVLAVPETLTAELACHVLERGFPLLLEKPPGRTVAELDRMVAAAAAGGPAGAAVPHAVAVNRRFVPLVCEARRRVERLRLQHIRYEMVRVNRRDPDFSITAIHGIDAVRFLADSDYVHVRFRYQELGELGPGVANIFMDAVLASGATAHLSFCPVAGVVVERAELHAFDHTLFLEVPMWAAFDAPGRLQHLEHGVLREEVRGDAASPSFEQGGFYAELEAFLDDLGAGRRPGPDLSAVRQSVAVAEAMRARQPEYRA